MGRPRGEGVPCGQLPRRAGGVEGFEPSREAVLRGGSGGQRARECQWQQGGEAVMQRKSMRAHVMTEAQLGPEWLILLLDWPCPWLLRPVLGGDCSSAWIPGSWAFSPCPSPKSQTGIKRRLPVSCWVPGDFLGVSVSRPWKLYGSASLLPFPGSFSRFPRLAWSPGVLQALMRFSFGDCLKSVTQLMTTIGTGTLVPK